MLLVLAALAMLGVGAALARKASQPAVLDVAGHRLIAQPRVGTGHQRAERLAFADGGRLLAVACPRYNRLVLYRVEPGPAYGPALRLLRDVETEGRPVALASARDRLYVLQRPVGDARHLEPSSWQAYDFQGVPRGVKFRLGWDADDLALDADGRLAVVLLSGRAEGESNRPAPGLVVVDCSRPDRPRVRGSLTFDQARDDPARIALMPGFSPPRAAVALEGSNAIAWIDLADPDRPRLLRRAPAPPGVVPGSIAFDRAGGLLVAALEGGRLFRMTADGAPAEATGFPEGTIAATPLDLPDGRALVLGLDRRDSALDVLNPEGRAVHALPLRGPWNLGRVDPVGLASGGSRVAVADRSGGVHLIESRRSPGGR